MVQNTQTIPTQEESLMMYLADRIIDTRGHIIRINNNLKRLDKDFYEAQSREARMEWAKLIDNERLGLENYQFRLDWLQTQLEQFRNTL